jgi:hypothetical protein
MSEGKERKQGISTVWVVGGWDICRYRVVAGNHKRSEPATLGSDCRGNADSPWSSDAWFPRGDLQDLDGCWESLGVDQHEINPWCHLLLFVCSCRIGDAPVGPRPDESRL